MGRNKLSICDVLASRAHASDTVTTASSHGFSGGIEAASAGDLDDSCVASESRRSPYGSPSTCTSNASTRSIDVAAAAEAIAEIVEAVGPLALVDYVSVFAQVTFTS